MEQIDSNIKAADDDGDDGDNNDTSHDTIQVEDLNETAMMMLLPPMGSQSTTNSYHRLVRKTESQE